MASKIGKTKMKLRRITIERVFGTIKTWAGKIPILTRGLKNVVTELKIYCLAYNAKRLINMFSLKEFRAIMAQEVLYFCFFYALYAVNIPDMQKINLYYKKLI